MKILRTTTLIDQNGFSETKDYQRCLNNVKEAIQSIEYPKESGHFYLYDEKQGNGVKPIKDAFIKKLNMLGWEDEKKVSDPEIKRRRIDSALKLDNGKYFAAEWETGNISSSHRALNRIILGMMEGVLSGGFLVLPSRSMYYYLTDRIGNYQELEPYFKVWQAMNHAIQDGTLKIIEIEHDGVGKDIPPIKKGTDGWALV